MKIKAFLLITLLSFPQISLTGTDVYVKNCTPYTFKVVVGQKGETLSSKRWETLNSEIKPFTTIKILNFARDRGVKKGKEYFFDINLKTNAPELKDTNIGLHQRMRGKLIGSKLWWSFSKDKTREKWFDKKNDTWLTPFILKEKIISENSNPHDVILRCRPFRKGKSFTDLEYLIGGRNRYRPYEIEPAEDAHKLNVLAYNVYLMHVKIVGITIERKPGLDERSELIPQAIEGYDVLIFSEMFVDKLRKKVLKKLKTFGYKYSTCILGSGFLCKENPNKHKLGESLSQPFIVNFNDSRFGPNKVYTQGGKGGSFLTGKIFKPENGGIIIVSKYPITKAKELIYKTKTTSDDKYAKKGVVYAKINKKDKIYHIFGTHPEAVYEKVRFKQLEELKNFIEDQKISKEEPILIGGDLNVDKKGEPHMLEILNAVNPPLKGKEEFSADTYKNQLKHLDKKMEEHKKLDYILFSRSHKQPTSSYNEIRPITSIADWKAKGFYPMNDLSDHYAVYGFFDFSEPKTIPIPKKRHI